MQLDVCFLTSFIFNFFYFVCKTFLNQQENLNTYNFICKNEHLSNNSLSVCLSVLFLKVGNFLKMQKLLFSKFYGKVGVISWLLFHLIWKDYVLYWDFDLKSWIVAFFTRFTREKRPQNNFSCQNFGVENSYFQILWKSRCHISITFPSHLKITIFYTEILTRKVVLWSFFTSETSEKIHKSTYQVEHSVQNVHFFTWMYMRKTLSNFIL